MKRLLKILFIVGCLSVIFVNVVSAYNSTNSLFDIDSYGYATPDYMVITDGPSNSETTTSLTITPTQTVSVPTEYSSESPYISNSTANVYGTGNPIFYIPEQITVSGEQRNPTFASSLNFGGTGIYDIAHDFIDNSFTNNTNIFIGYDEFYLPMQNTGANTIKYDIPQAPYYEFKLPQVVGERNFIRIDYELEYYTYDNGGNASVEQKTVKVLVYPWEDRMEGTRYIIPVMPFGNPSTQYDGFLEYSAYFDDNGTYKVRNSEFTKFVTDYLQGIHRAYDPSHPTSISKLTDVQMTIYLTPQLKQSYSTAIHNSLLRDTVFTRHSFLGTNYNHSYTDAFYQENYDIRFGSSLAGRITDNTAWITWLIDSIDAFMDIRIGQNFTIGTISLVALSITTVILILKFFAGG